MNAEELRDELLAEIARRFYQGVDAKGWAQDRDLLIQAICAPARWLNDRGATLPGGVYRQILRGILADTQAHMAQKTFKRRAAYLLHCVQAHMAHQGERYYEEAKGSKRAGAVAGRAVARLKIEPEDQAVKVLAETHRVLRGRKVARKPRAETQKELF